MSRFPLKHLIPAFAMLVAFGCASTQPVKEKGPEPPRNLVGTTDELQLVTELLVSLTSEHGTDPILVVLAIDDTLLADGQVRHSCESNSPAQPHTMPRLVQPDTATQVERMQSNGVKVIAISERRPECARQVFAELNHYDISFKKSAWPSSGETSGEFTPDGAREPIAYEDGVILASGQDAGQMLKAVLNDSGAPLPSLIVMVDYQQQDLSAVMKAFAFSGTKVHAWRYTRLDTASNNRDTAQS